jgi:hypothetical protein
VTDLAEWLLACIAEDEEAAPDIHHRDCESVQFDYGGVALGPCGCSEPTRVLAECAAKRRIVEHLAATASKCPADDWPNELGMEWASLADQARYVLRLLALPYAGREGYDPAWTPSDS